MGDDCFIDGGDGVRFRHAGIREYSDIGYHTKTPTFCMYMPSRRILGMTQIIGRGSNSNGHMSGRSRLVPSRLVTLCSSCY
jgi:hypothetical protein